jgi:hypothetical protein
MNQYVMCIDNTGYRVSLELFRVYQVAPQEPGDELMSQAVRIVDEGQESHLFASSRFVPVELPKDSARAFSELTARLEQEWADHLAALGPEDREEAAALAHRLE